MKPKIYVWCNSCDHKWHSFVAIAEDDGTVLAGHICSDHSFAYHDMGVDEDGWKREIYAARYPDGFEVEMVERENVRTHPGLNSAFAKNRARMREINASDQQTEADGDQPKG